MKNIFWTVLFLVLSIVGIIFPLTFLNHPILQEYSTMVVLSVVGSVSYIAAFSIFIIIKNFELVKSIVYEKMLKYLRYSIKPDAKEGRDITKFIAWSYFFNVLMFILFSTIPVTSIVTLIPVNELFTLIEMDSLNIRLIDKTFEALIFTLALSMSGPIFLMILRQLYRKHSTTSEEKFPGSRILLPIVYIIPIVIFINSYPPTEEFSASLRQLLNFAVVFMFIPILIIWLSDIHLFKNKNSLKI